MSLRLRLLLGLIALVAIGLIAIDAVTYLALQSSLMQQMDAQLRGSAAAVYSCLVRPVDTSAPQQYCPGAYVLGGSYGELLSGSDGTRLAYLQFTPVSPTPRVPAALIANAGTPGGFATAPGVTGNIEFRILVAAAPGNTVLVLAIPLTSVDATLSQLKLLEVLVSAAILVLLGVLAWWTVQLGLSPLRRIRDTAQKIAAGDLSQRVETVDPRTEVGQLGVSLNEMLSQIEQAFDARTASEDRLRQFVADASHELRTPLSSIRGYAELFRRGASANPDDLGKAMSRIESESIRMGQLVDDLLLLARLDEGRPLELQQVDLSQLAVDSAADQSAADRNHPIAVLAPRAVVVPGDEARLRQVVANLLRNAAVHTPERTAIQIEVEGGEGVGIVSVVDHGPGIPADSQERIFERFVRMDRSRGRARGGAGLGLAIVAAIVAAHHGRITHLPTPGGGATFQVELPAIQPEVPGPSRPFDDKEDPMATERATGDDAD
ncbi:MAG: sensor histidine kinase [Candidatus Dormibacteria bacterium]